MSLDLDILDLVTINEGAGAGEAIAATVDLAQHAEDWGYRRYWMAEHHNMPGVASSSTAVLIGHVADRTSTIRVGAGGVMLPNHPPLVVAEQFGTLASMHPGRIDLGLGRAPGTDPMTSLALRRDQHAAMDFAGEVAQLQRYLGDEIPGAKVRAIPGEGTHVPIWILGSSHGGAQVAAARGLPYSFASHFAPAALMSALEVYREGFRPAREGDGIAEPRTMAGVNVMVAGTRAEAERQFTSTMRRFAQIATNQRGPVPPPDGDIASVQASLPPQVARVVMDMLACSFVGTPDQVRSELMEFADATGVDEVIVSCSPYDQETRLRSHQLLAEAVLA